MVAQPLIDRYTTPKDEVFQLQQDRLHVTQRLRLIDSLDRVQAVQFVLQVLVLGRLFLTGLHSSQELLIVEALVVHEFGLQDSDLFVRQVQVDFGKRLVELLLGDVAVAEFVVVLEGWPAVEAPLLDDFLQVVDDGLVAVGAV